MQCANGPKEADDAAYRAEARPFVSVVVPVYNDLDGIRQCLQALEAQSYPADRYEVLVVDNGSSQGIAKLTSSFPHARALYEPVPSSYAARNLGIANARGEVIAFTDADCIPPAEWIERGVAKLLAFGGCGLIAGRISVLPRDAAKPTAVELYEVRNALNQRDYVERGRFGATANLFTFRALFDSIGLFDQSVRSGGDLEWGQRAAAHGYRVVYAEDVCVSHPARRSFRQLYAKTTRIVGGLHDLKRRKRGEYVSLGKSFFRDALPPIRASVAVWCDPNLSAIGKLKVVGALFFVQYVQLAEMIRLKLGGRSRR